MRVFNFKTYLLVFLAVAKLCAETQSLPKLAVLPTTDLTPWKLSEALQYSLGKMAYNTRYFNVGSSTYVLPGFTRKDLKRAFESNRAPLLMFAYIEPTRVSIFLFNAYQFGKFIASNKSLENAPEGRISSDFVEAQFKSAFDETMALFAKNEYQELPKSPDDDIADPTDNSSNPEVSKEKSRQMKELFHEVSKLEDKSFYFGANIGMVRYSDPKGATSTVNFGLAAGARFNYRMSLGVGADLFSYTFVHGDGYYKFPLAEKYISLSGVASFGSVMNSLTENKGYGTDNTTLKVGSFLFGPGIAVDIPLLGALLRGELKYYFGGSSVLVGTYGLVISL